MNFFCIFLLFFYIPLLFCLPTPEDTEIISGTTWYDTDHNEIHAHGGGIWFDTAIKKYYWVGTTKKLPPSWLSEGINLYSSYDLGTWTFEGEIFHNTSIRMPTGAPFRIERPKIIYNQSTKKFVMWFHLDSASFSLRSVGVAISDTINGKYQFVAGFKPDGLDSYDMTLYQDDDGSAYLCRSVENNYAGISKLTPDYMNTTGIISKGPRVEGQAIFKLSNGRYYLLGSHLTGWDANQAVLSVSNGYTLEGADWTVLPVITNSSTTYQSQSTFVLPYRHPNGKVLYIFMGDRWAYPRVDLATYIWLPLVIDGDKISLPWEPKWIIRDF